MLSVSPAARRRNVTRHIVRASSSSARDLPRSYSASIGAP
jgi:hypothetical protein